MEYKVFLILLLIGFIFGKLVLSQSSRNYDIRLLIATIFFFIFGSKTAVFSSSDFNIMLSNLLPPFLLGIVARRYITRFFA